RVGVGRGLFVGGGVLEDPILLSDALAELPAARQEDLLVSGPGEEGGYPVRQWCAATAREHQRRVLAAGLGDGERMNTFGGASLEPRVGALGQRRCAQTALR